MELPLKAILILTCALSSLFANESTPKPPVGFLIQSKEYKKAINHYQDYVQKEGHHDFELLQQMALSILEQGIQSPDPEEKLLALFGASLASTAPSQGALVAALASDNPYVESASLQLIAQLQDDRYDELINRAMSSPYFGIRLEAAHILSLRKSKTAAGQIESLMYKLPPEYHYIFAEFFARIGTPESIAILKQMMNNPFHYTRIAAILSAAAYGRDDLLTPIRAHLTHLNLAEQEACAAALGVLKDSKSIKKLEKLSKVGADTIKLSSLRSLYFLGKEESKIEIEALAHEKNLFAISLLGEMPGAETTLIPLLKDENLSVQFNAALSLLRLKNPNCVKPLLKFLIRDTKDLGFIPTYSVGTALNAFKVVSSSKQKGDASEMDIVGFSLYLREKILRETIELPEEAFLSLLRTLFNSRQKELVPVAVYLLSKRGSPECLKMLEEYSNMTGAPFVRGYCNLTLFRQSSDPKYAERVRSWLEKQKAEELIRFKPQVMTKERPIFKAFELSPEENSALLIDSCLSLAEKHDEKSIDILLMLLKEGNPKNRSLLAAVLLNTLH